MGMLPSLLCKSQSLLTSRGISLLGMLCLPAVLCQASTGKGQSPKDTGWTLTLHLICTWSFLLSRGKSVYCNFLPVGKLCLSALVRKRAFPGRWLCWGCASVSPKEACSPCWALALALPFPGQTQQIAARSWGVNTVIPGAVSLGAGWCYLTTLVLPSVKVRAAASL